MKYNKAHLLNFFNKLHKYKDFANLLINDFLLQDGLLISRTLCQNAFDLNNDPDTEVDNNFYTKPALVINITNPV